MAKNFNDVLHAQQYQAKKYLQAKTKMILSDIKKQIM